VPDLSEFEAVADNRQVKKQVLGKISDLLERSGIDVDDIGQIHRVNLWQGMSKGDDGPEVTDLMGIRLSPAWESGPEWPVVQQAKPCVVKHTRKLGQRDSSFKVTAILPDTQIGYWRHEGELVPMHDEAAMRVTLELLAAMKPQAVVWLGDTLDLAEWSGKFLVLPEFALTTQESVDRAHLFLAECLAAAGPQVENAYLLEGNHDNRMANAITRNAMAALRLRRANQPDSWPILSVPNLLRLDELGVTYVDGYPAGAQQIAAGNACQTPLFVIHGEKLDVARQARSDRISTIQGHAHHVAHNTQRGRDGIEVEAWSLGCLCRIDGAVPSTKGGNTVRGRHVPRNENWQHAIGVVTENGSGWSVETVRIREGKALWRGAEYGV
jgi:hypothetical protein